MKRIIHAGLILFASLAHAETAIISAAQFGNDWPLTVPSGVVSCEPASDGSTQIRIVTFVADGKTYAVNGTAMAIAKRNKAWRDIEEIWKPDPQYPKQMKMNIGPVLDTGLALCKHK
ncbi:MAG: DUF2511 domain-containing protein [Candidatus Competibacter denitrificans]|jgi:hypothetical protein